MLEEVRQERHLVRGHFLLQILVELERVGVGRLLELHRLRVGGERPVERFFTDVVAQGVHHDTAFAIVDVLLVLHQQQRHLLDQLAGTVAQVVVELVLQESVHLLGTVFLLHHHQRRVLRHRLHQECRALHVAANHLVSPPLVCHLVRGDIERVVEGIFVVLVKTGDEADRLRERHGVGERLCELLIARELENAHLAVLVRAERGLEIVEGLLDRVDHPVDVVVVSGVMVDLNRNVTVTVALDLILGR